MIPKSNIAFKSKRNQCYFDRNKNCVIKKFINRESYVIEKFMLKRLETSPKLISAKLLNCDDELFTLEIEYIEGSLVLQKLENYELSLDFNSAIDLLSQLINWLNDFYLFVSVFLKEENLHGVFDKGVRYQNNMSKRNHNNHKELKLIYGDVNLRNFIVTNEGIIGIDFEQCDLGYPGEEVEYLLAMFMLYNPKETVFKYKVLEAVCEKKSIDLEHVKVYMKQIIDRRKK
jgi:tRNA A-37 threonylcarbamoyl transferase component Bud32